jgi:hypothetical protein
MGLSWRWATLISLKAIIITKMAASFMIDERFIMIWFD